MNIESVTLENFRSAEAAFLHFVAGDKLLIGDTAPCISNFLEAIYFFARGKSFRAARESDLVRFGADGCAIDIVFVRRGKRETLGFRYFDGARQRPRHGVKMSVRDTLGVFCAELFCPDHLSIIKRTPAERREFINAAMAQTSPAYVAALGRHKKLLENKNALLRREDGFDAALMESYNEELAAVSAEILTARRAYLARLGDSVRRTVAEISGGREDAQIEYKCDIPAEKSRVEDVISSYRELFRANLAREAAAKTSLFGVQRDDLIFYVNGREARQFDSQGQQVSVALALQQGEGEILAEEFAEEPVYLLDDVLGELDETRKSYILSRTGGRQLIVTACEKNDYDALTGVKKIHACGGQYTEDR